METARRYALMDDSGSDDDAVEPPPKTADPDSSDTEDSSVVAEFQTHYMPLYIITAFFACMFAFGPLIFRKSPHKGIIRCSLMLSAVSMWLLWVTVYIAQMNPLIGPRLANHTLAWIAYRWGDPIDMGGSGSSSDDAAPSLSEEATTPAAGEV